MVTIHLGPKFSALLQETLNSNVNKIWSKSMKLTDEEEGSCCIISSKIRQEPAVLSKCLQGLDVLFAGWFDKEAFPNGNNISQRTSAVASREASTAMDEVTATLYT